MDKKTMGSNPKDTKEKKKESKKGGNGRRGN